MITSNHLFPFLRCEHIWGVSRPLVDNQKLKRLNFSYSHKPEIKQPSIFMLYVISDHIRSYQIISYHIALPKVVDRWQILPDLSKPSIQPFHGSGYGNVQLIGARENIIRVIRIQPDQIFWSPVCIHKNHRHLRLWSQHRVL